MTDVREILLAISIRDTRYCVHCGEPFQTYVASRRLVCSPRCNTARWRACVMLAGTHGYRDGRLKRLELKDD
jgi:hypothetical protein